MQDVHEVAEDSQVAQLGLQVSHVRAPLSNLPLEQETTHVVFSKSLLEKQEVQLLAATTHVAQSLLHESQTSAPLSYVP